MCFNFMAQLLSDVFKKPRALPVEAGGELSCLHCAQAGERVLTYLLLHSFFLDESSRESGAIAQLNLVG